MDKKIINWGIIGCGDVCEVKSGPGFQLAEGSSLNAVMRRNKGKAKDFAHRHKVPKYYADADELINDAEIDAVYIATPPSTHAKYAIDAMKAGKPVYVEKPMALNYFESKTMIEASEKFNTTIFVAYYRRFFPYFLKIKELIDLNQLGKLITVNLTTIVSPRAGDEDKKNPHWHLIPKISGGGYFFDVACHQLDILDFLMGPIEDAHSFYTNRAGIYDVEDTLVASLKFESGVLASCNWTYVGEKNNEIDRIEIIGAKGMLSFGISGDKPIFLNIEGKEQTFSFEKPKHVEQPMIEQVTKSFLGTNELKSNMYAASRTSWVMDRIMGR